MWAVRATDEYLEWFNQQSTQVKEVILAKAYLLQAFGPQLGRPHADTLKGSSVKNLKELRASADGQILRVLYYFNQRRQALLIIGGNKKGKNDRDFYQKLTTEAERLIVKYKE